MATNQIEIEAPCSAVWRFLMEPRNYPRWVVGAKEVRHVDERWPEPGARFGHSSGVAGEVKDVTEIILIEEPHRLVLEAYARPFGQARIILELEEKGDVTRFTIREGPAPGTLLRRGKLLLDPLMHARNSRGVRLLKEAVEQDLQAGKLAA